MYLYEQSFFVDILYSSYLCNPQILNSFLEVFFDDSSSTNRHKTLWIPMQSIPSSTKSSIAVDPLRFDPQTFHVWWFLKFSDFYSSHIFLVCVISLVN